MVLVQRGTGENEKPITTITMLLHGKFVYAGKKGGEN